MRASIHHYTTYRWPENFRNPEKFAPERWMGDPAYAGDQRKALQPFSYGPRNCLGQNMAMHEVRRTAKSDPEGDYILLTRVDEGHSHQGLLRLRLRAIAKLPRLKRSESICAVGEGASHVPRQSRKLRVTRFCDLTRSNIVHFHIISHILQGLNSQSPVGCDYNTSTTACS